MTEPRSTSPRVSPEPRVGAKELDWILQHATDDKIVIPLALDLHECRAALAEAEKQRDGMVAEFKWLNDLNKEHMAERDIAKQELAAAAGILPQKIRDLKSERDTDRAQLAKAQAALAEIEKLCTYGCGCAAIARAALAGVDAAEKGPTP